MSNNNTTQMTSNRGTFNNKISPYEESLKFKNKKMISRNSSTTRWEI